MNSSPLFFATSGPTKRRKHYLCLLFSQYWTWAEKCQWSRHLFDKSIPGLPRLEPHRKVNATTLEQNPQTFKTLRKTANLFSNLDFSPKYGFPKTLDLSMDFPWISPPPRIFGEAARAADKKCGGVWGGGGSPPHEFSRPGSLVQKLQKLPKN